MAGPIPDARSLQSWEEAFQYPLPVVRKLESQLRKNIDDNRQKLRVLVGGSYRDLLGTAERIIEMDEQMTRVEGLLGEIGAQCNAGVVEKRMQSFKKMRMERTAKREDWAILAQTKVLQSSLTVVMRIVKAKGDALQAAKLFVLARLLHKSLSERKQPPPVVVGNLRRKLHSLRSRLLSYVERDMARISTETARLPNTLCAYVLIASSTAKDALRHFLQIRYDQLDRKMEKPSEEAEVLELLTLYGQTLLDTRDLFPRKVADVLGQISRNALLLDEQVTSRMELNLDIYGSWIPEDIRSFTPWVRHDQLVSSEVADALTAWTGQARTCLLERLTEYLENQTDARAILQSRYRFVSRLLHLSSRVKNATSADGIEKVREAFLGKMAELAESAAGMGELTLDESQVSTLSDSTKAPPDIWSLASEDFDLSNGGVLLRRSILGARHGRHGNLDDEIAKLDDWAKRVNVHMDIADDIASTKWEDELDFELDFADTESLQRALSQEDAETLRTRLRQAIQATLQGIVSKILEVGNTTMTPAFYIRIWREVALRRSGLDKRLGMTTETVTLTDLYRNVGSTVLNEVLPDFVQAVKRPSPSAVALWDGSPPLPVQCSPATFRFLTRLHQGMSQIGTDVWTWQCVTTMKGVVVEMLGRELLSEEFTRPVEEEKPQGYITNGHAEVTDSAGHDVEKQNGAESGDSVESEEGPAETAEAAAKEGDDEDESGTVKSNGEGGEKEEEKTNGTIGEVRRSQVVQNLFDTHYLLHVLWSPSHSASEAKAMDELIRALQESSQLDEASQERLRKTAGEFWKKTHLLFGLLAPASDSGAV